MRIVGAFFIWHAQFYLPHFEYSLYFLITVILLRPILLRDLINSLLLKSYQEILNL